MEMQKKFIRLSPMPETVVFIASVVNTLPVVSAYRFTISIRLCTVKILYGTFLFKA